MSVPHVSSLMEFNGEGGGCTCCFSMKIVLRAITSRTGIGGRNSKSGS